MLSEQPPHGVKQCSWSSFSKLAVLPEDFFLFFCHTTGSVLSLSFALFSQFPGLPFQDFSGVKKLPISDDRLWIGF